MYPTEAHQATVALLHRTVVEAARRRQDDLPGLVETLQDDVLLTTGGTARPVHGWFAERTWHYGDRQVHELFVSADRPALEPPVSYTEDVLVTLLHEACHVWAQANGIKDVSRDGRYHNRRFAEIALAIGLQIEKDKAIGHRTPRLSARGRFEYDDLLKELDSGLVLTWRPAADPAAATIQPTGDDTEAGSASDTMPVSKYVFASCRCPIGRGRMRTIRASRGSWQSGTICCTVCREPFAESPTTEDAAVPHVGLHEDEG